LTEEFFQLKKSAAVGVDGVTWRDYEQNLGDNIADLQGRFRARLKARAV
jgi:RNA-directed DNA polymerase